MRARVCVYECKRVSEIEIENKSESESESERVCNFLFATVMFTHNWNSCRFKCPKIVSIHARSVLKVRGIAYE